MGASAALSLLTWTLRNRQDGPPQAGSGVQMADSTRGITPVPPMLWPGYCAGPDTSGGTSRTLMEGGGGARLPNVHGRGAATAMAARATRDLCPADRVCRAARRR